MYWGAGGAERIEVCSGDEPSGHAVYLDGGSWTQCSGGVGRSSMECVAGGGRGGGDATPSQLKVA